MGKEFVLNQFNVFCVKVSDVHLQLLEIKVLKRFNRSICACVESLDKAGAEVLVLDTRAQNIVLHFWGKNLELFFSPVDCIPKRSQSV